MRPRRIAIIGGGITGLAAAHRLHELAPKSQVVVYEASSRWGGILGTRYDGGWLIEQAADMFTTREPWAIDLCKRLGIDGDLISTNRENRRALVVRGGKLYPVPDGFTLLSPSKIYPLLVTPLLSWSGKLRMASELFVRRRSDKEDESLAAFTRRRLGNEAFDHLVQPLVGGIYTADPEKLSMKATLSQFVEQERTYGGLIRAMWNSARKTKTDVKPAESGARYGAFVAPKRGMQSLVDALAQKLPEAWKRLDSPVGDIRWAQDEQIWRIAVEPKAGEPYTAEADDLIFAVPGTKSNLLTSVSRDLAAAIAKIPHAGASVVILGVRRDQIQHPLDAFGVVVPAVEKRGVIAISFASVKFPGRAPDDSVLLRVFVGGALQPELARLSDADLRKLVLEELGSLIGFSGEPQLFQIARWLETMPQYHVGHLDVVREIKRLAEVIPHFALAGNAYDGVGIPFCIHSGELAAERILGMTSQTEATQSVATQ
jgi:oxygen-dependent protoporphyrinogen oxidase